MKPIHPLVVSMQDKLASNEDGISSKTGTAPAIEYPGWLQDVFVLLTATYGTLWTDPLLDSAVAEAVKRVWYFQLREFEPQVIRDALLQAGRIYKFPPKVAEMVEIAKNVRSRLKDEAYFKAVSDNRVLESPRPPSSRSMLEAKLCVWNKLGMKEKAREVMEALEAIQRKEAKEVPHAEKPFQYQPPFKAWET